MVLSETQQKELGVSIANYTILNTAHFLYGAEQFNCSVEILNCINRVAWINETCKLLGSPIQIETAPFHKAIDSVLNGQPLQRKEIEHLFDQLGKVYKFSQAIRKHGNTENGSMGYELPFIACFAMHGMTVEQHDKLKTENVIDLHDRYASLYCDVIDGKISYDEYFDEVDKLIAAHLKPELKAA